MNIKLSIAKKLFGKNIKDLFFLKKDYLEQTGWNESIEKRKVVDKHGKAIPWYSYPAIYFLKNKLKKEYTVFEFGSGNSTIFYAKNCKSVVSFEDDEKWFETVCNATAHLENIKIYYKNDKFYFSAPFLVSQSNKFDIIVIDGGYRNECCKTSIDLVSDRGIIILDNSERLEYRKGIELLQKNGFKKIEFFGLAPCNHYGHETSIFYKENNIFGI